jgi:hypothetical protein
MNFYRTTRRYNPEACTLLNETSARLVQITHNKVNVKLSLCLVKHSTMKTGRGSGNIDPRFLISALDGGDWSA